MDIILTCCKKLYIIAELFNDDLSLVATAIKMTIVKDDHKTILKNLLNNDIDKYSSKIDLLFEISKDHYYIDGLCAIIEAVHSHTEHGVDNVRSNIDTGIIVGEDTVKGSQLSLFNNEDND